MSTSNIYLALMNFASYNRARLLIELRTVFERLR